AFADVVDDRPDRVEREDLGHAVLDVVWRGEGGDDFARVERPVEDAPRVAVEHETRRQVRSRRAKELEAILLGAGQRALVRQDDTVLEGDDAHEREKSTPRATRPAARRLEALIVAVKRRLF